MLQHDMIARVRELCADDDRLDAAMMYGSFAYGEGDRFSDIEFLLFFRDDIFDQIDPRSWLAQIAPIELLYVNEHGIHTAIFANLVRGEFHFHRASEVTIGAMWRGLLTFPSVDAALIADKSDALRPYLDAITGPPPARDALPQVQNLVCGFINWTLFGINVLRRGEYTRALELLNILHRHLLHMVRLLEGQTAHWLTPSRAAEDDLSRQALERFAGCVAASLAPEDLRRAYHRAWTWGGELMNLLRAQYGIVVPDELCWRITAYANEDGPTEA